MSEYFGIKFSVVRQLKASVKKKNRKSEKQREIKEDLDTGIHRRSRIERGTCCTKQQQKTNKGDHPSEKKNDYSAGDGVLSKREAHHRPNSRFVSPLAAMGFWRG